MPVGGKNTVLDEYIVLANELKRIMPEVITQLQTLSNAGTKISGAKNINDLNRETQNLNTVYGQLEQSERELLKADLAYKQALNDRKKEIRSEIKEEQAAKGSLDQKRAALSRMIKQYTSGENTSKKFRGEITKLRKEIEKKEKSLGMAQRGVARYTQSIKKAVLQMGGMYLGIQGLIRLFKNIIGITSDFEQQMDTTGAILRADELDMERLKNSAKEFGRTTSKTATQVGQLQEEMGKLGFTTREILKGTGGILALSEATRSDLADSARIAASTIRGFGKDASETNHIVDVMTKSFVTTGLNLQKYEVAMANAQVAAKSTNHTFEETVAMLGTIVDTGTDASKAGTDLRNIFAELAKKGISVTDAYEKVNKSSDKVVTAMELVGKRAFSSLITLAEHKEKVDQLSDSFVKADGTAQAMANTMKDNLKGDIDRAKSAWEGLVLSIDDGSGTITRSVRGTIKMFTQLFGWLTKINRTARERYLIETFEEANENAEKLVENLEGEALINTINERTSELRKLIAETSRMAVEAKKADRDELERKTALYINEREILLNYLDNIKIDKEEERQTDIEETELTEEEKAKIRKKWRDYEKQLLAEKEEDNWEWIQSQIELDNQANEEKKKNIDDFTAYLEQKAKEQENIFIDQKDKEVDANKELYEKLKKQYENRINLASDYAREAGAILGQSIADSEYSAKEAAKNIVLLTLKTIKSIIQQRIIADKVMATTGSLSSLQSVATGGVAGIIQAAVLVGLIEAAYQGVEALLESQIPSFFKGKKKTDSYSGFAIIGDPVPGSGKKGSTEILNLPDKSFVFDKPTLIKLPENVQSEIIPEKQIQRNLANLINEGKSVINVSGGISENKYEQLINKQTKEITRSIKNTPQPILKGLTIQGVKQGNNITLYRDKRFRHVGR